MQLYVTNVTAHPKYSYVTGEGLAGGVAGEKITFTIQAKDANDVSRTTGGDNFVVLLHGPAFIEAEVVDNHNGL
jgi:hypothetical protein